MAETLVCVKTDTRKVEMQKLPLAKPGPGQALFTHHMRLGETPAGYDLFRPRRDGVVKIAIRP